MDAVEQARKYAFDRMMAQLDVPGSGDARFNEWFVKNLFDTLFAKLGETHAVVPREATDQMAEAAHDQFDWGPPGYDDAPGGCASPKKVWSAMIAAASSQQKGAG